MKKILTILAISFSALMANSVTTAAPHDNDRDWDRPRHQSDNRGRDFRDNDDDERKSNRGKRELRKIVINANKKY